MAAAVSYCGRDVAQAMLSANIAPCFRETFFDTALPASVLLIGAVALLIRKYCRSARRDRSYDNDSFLNSRAPSPGDDDDDESESSTINDENSPLLPGQQESIAQRHPVVRGLIDFSKFALSTCQALLFAYLFRHRSEIPDDQRGPYRFYSVLIQAGTWAIVTLMTLALFIRTIASKRQTSAVRSTRLLNNFYVVAFLFAGLPRLYDAYLAYAVEDGHHRLRHSVYDNTELNAAGINVAISGVLALFFVLERRTRPATKHASTGRVHCPEQTASNISRAFFVWVNPLIGLGYKRTLNSEDLWELRPGDDSTSIVKRFRSVAPQSKDKSNRVGFMWRLVLTFKNDLLLQAVWGFLWALFAYSGPFFINRIIAYVENPGDAPVILAYLYAVGLLIGSALLTASSSQALWIGRRICIRLKGIVMGEVYIKTLKRADMSGATTSKDGDDDDDESSQATRGKITNMISVDAQKISEVSAYLHFLYSFPMQIAIGAYFLWSLLGWSALIGLSVFGILIPLNVFFSNWFERVQEELMKRTDKRIALMGELLQGVRIVKFFGWENNMFTKIMASRDEELVQLRRQFVGRIMSSIIWTAGPILITLLSFVSYTKLFHQELTASVAFTSLALFNSIRGPLDMFPEMIMSALQCRVSVARIQKFLDEPELTSTAAPEKRTTPSAPPIPSSSRPVVRRPTSSSLNPIVSLSRSHGYESFGTFGDADPFSSSPVPYIEGSESPRPSSLLINSSSSASGLPPNAVSEVASRKESKSTSKAKTAHPIVGFRNASFRWFATDRDAIASGNPFALRNLDIDFPVGELSIVAGATGCGKTSMILALLGEMSPYGAGGRAYLPDRHNNRVVDPETGLTEGIAYVAQQAWLQCATIRDNILFGQPFDRKRYDHVVFACALNRDLEILETGDQTEVGEKGITLSGGQKQRVALARALYSRAKHVLLDDCLSAVDAHTAKHIFEHCLLGELMRGRTRILVTHHVGLCLRGASLVVVMNDGRVTAQGTAQEVVDAGALTEEFLAESKRDAEDAAAEEKSKSKSITESESESGSKPMSSSSSSETVAGSGETSVTAAATDATVKKSNDDEDDAAKKLAGKLVTDEARSEGSVKFHVYDRYFKASGGTIFWMVLLVFFGVTQLTILGQDYWLRIWASAYGPPTVDSASSSSGHMAHAAASASVPAFMSSDAASYGDVSTAYLTSAASGHATAGEMKKPVVDLNYYLTGYCLLALASLVTFGLREVLQFWGSLRASRILYAALLKRVLRAPIRFFDTTPVGRIMNRFSKDFETIDQQVSGDAGMLLMDSMYTLTVLVVITVVSPLFAIAAIVIIAAYTVLGALYLKTSRELKRVESVSKSPCFTLLDETVIGVTTIRAFGEEKRFIDENFTRVDNQVRPFIWMWAANRWLSVRVDAAGALVAFFATCFVLVGNMDAGLAGFSLTYALTFTDRVLWVVRYYSINEMNLNSVERVEEYLDIEQEPPAVIENSRPPAAWPQSGHIEVEDLVLRYAPDLPPVLRGLTFDVKPGEKVGIVGRTGAGKSTLALAFFRFIEASEGKIFVDGIDISKLGLEDLRSRLTIIPQDPVLFSGTIRSNLDPFDQREDAEIWAALRRAHLIGEDAAASEGQGVSEDSAVSETAANPVSSLDAVVSENGANFSQGQRQLLALARALVKNSKVIILDEATASVDFETDAKIQRTVKEEFSSSTLLVIAHRLRTVVDYDKILVLDQGRVVEFGDPLTLMTSAAASDELLAASEGMKPGLFRAMCERTGSAEFEALLEIARAK